jgi:hypothetical protein
MAVCSICANSELAGVINQLLFEEIGLDVIAEKTGAHRSTIFRHKKSCFVEWRAARLKAKSDKTPGDGRLFVKWPGEPIPAGCGPGDDLLIVEYVVTNVADIVARGNPRALGTEHVDALHGIALTENAKREHSRIKEPA